MTKTAQILDILTQRYPCAELPYGALMAIAREVEASHQLVQQVAKKNGFSGPGHARWGTRVACASCEADLGLLSSFTDQDEGKMRFCADCRYIDIPCTECGKLKRVSAARYVWYIGESRTVSLSDGTTREATYKGNVFCDRQCLGRYAGKHYGWGVTRARKVS